MPALPPPGPLGPPARRAAALAAVLAAAGSSCAGSWPAARPQAAAPLQAPESWLPLRPGATWVYDVAVGGNVRRVSWRVTGSAEVGGAEAARRVWQVHVTDGERDCFVYFASDRDGVRRFANAIVLNMPGLDPAGPAALLLPGPVGIETRWRTAEREVLVAGAHTDLDPTVVLPPEPNDEREAATLPLDGTLRDPSARVVVPAGTFVAAHVRLEQEREAGRTVRAEELWFARGPGIVRRELHDGSSRVVAELVSFTPGAPAADPERLRAALAAAGVTGEPRWLRLPVDGLLPRCRFALVPRGGDGPPWRLVRVCGEEATPFDPLALADWRAWQAREHWSSLSEPGTGGGGGWLLRLAGDLRLAERGRERGEDTWNGHCPEGTGQWVGKATSVARSVSGRPDLALATTLVLDGRWRVVAVRDGP